MAELLTLRPLFPGSSEADQIYKICSVLGSPTMRNWPEGIKLAASMNFRLPQFVATPLQQLIPHAGSDAIQLLTDCLKFDPSQRPTAAQILQYPFFQVNAALPAPLPAPSSGAPLSARSDPLEGEDVADSPPPSALPPVKPAAAAAAKPMAASSYASMLPSALLPSGAGAGAAAGGADSFLKPRYGPASSSG